MGNRRLLRAAAAVVVLGALQLAAAHGDETGDMKMDMSTTRNNSTSEESTIPIWEDFQPSYFRHGEYTGWMTLHILTMVIGWVMVLPTALMLSVARSSYHLPAQVTFHAVNGIGIFAGFVYNHATPDLYVVNAHHTLGWVLHAFAIAWTLLSFCSACNDWQKRNNSTADRPLLSQQSMAAHNQFQRYADRPSMSRLSRDSGNFSGGRTNSSDSVAQKDESMLLSPGGSDHVPLDDGFEDVYSEEKPGLLGNAKLGRMLSQYARTLSGAHVSSAIRLSQIVLEKSLLLLGFAALTTGFVTYGGIFRGNEVFSGLAHYIKGAIFFWFGLLTLGRWMGAFAEFGWAWNIRPQQPLVATWKTYIPSAEFTESFVIWLYGASNVFLEHLGSTEPDWSPQDFEHVSITVLFFGGGLLGMLVESRWLRNLMSTQVLLHERDAQSALGASHAAGFDEAGVEQAEEWIQPKTEGTSLNPMPALVIMLLGMMMSGHHQQSMVSTMMHGSFGKLFSGFAMSRLVTYILMFLKPPTSHFPARPPSELIAAFCLIAGGIIFMNSASDSVRSIETNGLDAMSVFTVTMGLTGLIMAWEVICFALKGWSVRRERMSVG